MQKRFDLIRGEGDWKNMQSVVRSSFKELYDHSEKQQKQIQDLLEIAINLKSQLALRPSQEELQRIVEDKVRLLLPRSVSKDKHESLAANVAALRSELERKATVAYVDDSLRRKLDKSDAVVRQLATSGADLQVSLRALVKEETSMLVTELGQVRSMQETLYRQLADTQRDAGPGGAGRFELRAQLSALSSTVDDLSRTVASIDLDHLERSVAAKADRVEVESLLAAKAERSALASGLGAVERALAEHDRVITSLRLRPIGGPSSSAGAATTGGSKGGIAADDHIGDGWDFGQLLGMDANLFDSTVGMDMGVGVGMLGVIDGAPSSTDLEGGATGVGRRLRAGREEMVLQSLWQRVQVLSREVGRGRSECRVLSVRVDGLEVAVNACAGAAQVEALAVIAEEQRVSIPDFCVIFCSFEN